MAQPIVKYTLSKQGRVPEWLSSDSRAFAGEHGVNGNKSGYIPRYESPQETIFLGVASGEPDSDGTPDDYVGKIASKSDLQAYILGIGTIAGYKVTTSTLTGIQTATTTGLATAWAAVESGDGYAGGLSTTTSSKQTPVGVGTTVVKSGSVATKIVTNVITDSASTFSTVTNAISVDVGSTSTVTGVSTNAVTTTSGGGGAGGGTGITTTIVTTTTTAFNYTDVQTGSSTSKSETTTDGVTTRTDTVTTREYTNFETSYDYAAEATRLWDIYTAINS